MGPCCLQQLPSSSQTPPRSLLLSLPPPPPSRHVCFLPYLNLLPPALPTKSPNRLLFGPKNGPFPTAAASTSADTEQSAPSTGTSTAFRPAVILPGLGNNSKDYVSLVSALEDRGIRCTVAQVSRPDWLRNAAGLLNGNYWAGTLQPRPVLDWYLGRIRNAITLAKTYAQEDSKVSLIGHSAGGWLARVYMSEFGIDDIALLVTLGTPHLPPPKGVPGVIDQTRGLLDYVETTCPGTCFAPGVKYVCVAGRYLKGDRFFSATAPKVSTSGIGTIASAGRGEVLATAEQGGLQANNGAVLDDGERITVVPSLRARIVGQGYKQVCGQADVWGDGVVPEKSAHLEGAINISLEGVYHSPVGSNDLERPWYGSKGVLETWMHHLLN